MNSKSQCHTAQTGIIFAGTPEFAGIHLQALLDANIKPIAVYTQPDRRAGRGKKLTPSRVKQIAMEADIPVFQPESFKDQQDIEQLAQLKPTLMIVVAYGLLLPLEVLQIPKRGCINVHGSLLPRWRGAAPIQRAIAAGDQKTGICLMQMEQGLDTGPVLAQQELPISDTDTAGQLHDRMAVCGAELLVKKLPLILDGKLSKQQQDPALANYAHKLEKREANLDWQKSAKDLSLLIRAFNPWPVCSFELSGERIRVWQASVIKNDSPHTNSDISAGTLVKISEDGLQVLTRQDLLQLEVIQLPGKKPMPVAELLRGQSDKFQVGMQL